MLDDPDLNKSIQNYLKGHGNIDWKSAAESYAQYIRQMAVNELPPRANPFDIPFAPQELARRGE